MRNIIERHLSSNFIIPFVVSSFAAISFMMIFQLFKITRLIIHKNVSITLMAKIVGNIMITYLPISTPLAVLFASIYALNRLSSDSELIAMRAFGVSIFKMLIPFLLLGITACSLLFALQYSFIPYSERSLKQALTATVAKGVLTDIRAGQFFTDIPGITIYAEGVSKEGKKLTQVFIHRREENTHESKESAKPTSKEKEIKDAKENLKKSSKDNLKDKEKDKDKDEFNENIILAQEGLIIDRDGNEPLSNKYGSNFSLQLKEGNIIKRGTSTSNNNNASNDENNQLSLEKIIFKEYVFPLTENSLSDFTGGLSAKDSMRTTKELYQMVVKNETLPNSKPMDKKERIKSELEFYTRINNSVLCIVFLLLGFSLGIQRGRGKNQNSLIISFLTLIIYYAILFTGISMARSSHISTALAVFTPSILAFLVSLIFYRRLQWII